MIKIAVHKEMFTGDILTLLEDLTVNWNGRTVTVPPGLKATAVQFRSSSGTVFRRSSTREPCGRRSSTTIFTGTRCPDGRAKRLMNSFMISWWRTVCRSSKRGSPITA